MPPHGGIGHSDINLSGGLSKDKAVQQNVSSLIIRSAVPSDVASLVEMVSCLAEHHGDHASANETTLDRDLFHSPPWAVALVAEQSGKLVGYVILIRLYQAQFASRIVDLHHLFVVPEARSTGVGKALMKAVQVWAGEQGCVRVVVGTHPSNVKAQNFYKSAGFKQITSSGPRFSLAICSPP